MKILFRMKRAALSELISPEVTGNTASLSKAFAAGQPFRHVVIDQFFQPDFCARLAEEFPTFDEKLAINENGDIGAKAVNEQVKKLGPAFAELNTLVAQDDFRQLIGNITNIEKLQFDPHYFGGGTHENRHGQDLDPHVDFNYHPRNGQHRRLNLIVYLNPTWEENWGGQLDLHSDPYAAIGEDQVTQIMPLLNRCVIFETTETSWHGFERINLPEPQRHISRKSFALYYYSKQRPSEQTAAPHSTVYVDRQLPALFEPGLTLSEEHIQQLEILLMRRDHHNKRLYRNIQDLSSQLASATSYLDYVKQEGQDGQNKDRSAQSPGTQEDIQRQSQQLAMLRSELAVMRSSKIWRMIRPIQAVKRRIRRLLNN